MQLLKLNNRYINIELVEHAEYDTVLGRPTIYLYYHSSNTVRVTDPDEVRALLAWLERTSTNVMRKV